MIIETILAVGAGAFIHKWSTEGKVKPEDKCLCGHTANFHNENGICWESGLMNLFPCKCVNFKSKSNNEKPKE